MMVQYCALSMAIYGHVFLHPNISVLCPLLSGVPGVKPERMSEAMPVQHCALSLYGHVCLHPNVSVYCVSPTRCPRGEARANE